MSSRRGRGGNIIGALIEANKASSVENNDDVENESLNPGDGDPGVAPPPPATVPVPQPESATTAVSAGATTIDGEQALTARIAELEAELARRRAVENDLVVATKTIADLQTQLRAYQGPENDPSLLKQEVQRLSQQVTVLQAGGGTSRKQMAEGLRVVPWPFGDDPTDIIVDQGAPTSFTEAKWVANWVRELGRTVQDAAGFDPGVYKKVIYNLGIMALAVVPDLQGRIAAKIGPKAHLLKRNRIDPLVDAIWEAFVEGVQGIRVVK